MNPQPAVHRRPNALGVHSLDRFVFSVPDIDAAERFYRSFGLDVRRDGDRLDLGTHDTACMIPPRCAAPMEGAIRTLGRPGGAHCWASVAANGKPKRLQYLRFSAYDEDFDALAARFRDAGRIDPHPLSDGGGVWTRDGDGTPVQLVAGAKVSPAAKAMPGTAPAVAPGKGAAPSRKTAPRVRPRRLSHVLLFTPDVSRQLAFYTGTLGLRLSDRSGDIIAFLHGVHASDHHVIAFAKSHAPGLHHSSWDVARFDDVGLGAELMRADGYAKGWGVGRHVLGSNYFYYVQDPWGSWAEYSFDIDFVPADVDWAAGDHPSEDSFYIWGPTVPDDFVVNHEAPAPV